MSNNKLLSKQNSETSFSSIKRKTSDQEARKMGEGSLIRQPSARQQNPHIDLSEFISCIIEKCTTTLKCIRISLHIMLA